VPQKIQDFFPDVFQLCAGKITPEQIREHIESAEISEEEKEQRRFYADLYIGLDYAARIHDTSARESLRRAVANKWAPEASYGPKWMWHVARVHFDQYHAAANAK